MSDSGSILVLTTREKDWWPSLQEIIPAIERVWTAVGRSGRKNVRMCCVPLAPEIERGFLQTSAPGVERIVLTTATPATVRVALLLRRQMEVAAPMIIYVHGDATEGFHAFGTLADVLTQRDMFVVSCEAEAIAARCSFPNAQVSVIPFPLVDQFHVSDGGQDTRQETARLAYVGRISEQKNLHTLLFALWIVRSPYFRLPRITLDVYGGADNLGSPNMGLRFPNYGAYLQGLTELLGLDEVVKWHGFKQRGWLFDNVHLKHHILVSPTLHSDENFGSSVLASLVNGHQVVTTAWGGHFGFQEWFPQQLALVPVHRSTMGPVVHPFLLANAILRAMNRMRTVVVKEATLERAREEFSVSAGTTRTFEMLSRAGGEPLPLEKSATQRYLDERRDFFGGTRRIYADYKDPAAQIFFEAYGMKEPLTLQEDSSCVLPPWTSYSRNLVRVVDPHRGHQTFSLDARVFNGLEVTMCPSMNVCRLPEGLVKSLVAQGSAFSFPAAFVAEARDAAERGM